MIDLWTSFALFLPVFLAVNVVAAVPGRADLNAAMRTGCKHFAYGTVIIVVASFALHLLMNWLIARPPLY